MSEPRFGPSVWRPPAGPRFEAVAVEPGETVDLAIVGGGLLGLSTALHAARAGLSVRVLEALRVGEGASGLNGGQVIAGLKHDPESILAHYGRRKGQALLTFSAGTADAVFDLIRVECLDVPHGRTGWIQAAHTDAAFAAAAERHRQWKDQGADASLLDAAAIARHTGTSTYRGGWLDRRGGVVDPLALTLELARIASAAGASIAERSRATRLRREAGRWTIDMAGGSRMRADRVVVAANAYADELVPGLARSLVALHSFQIATRPLTEVEAAPILPGGQAVSDSRRILVYYRRTPDGRFMLGGRGRMGLPRGPADWAHLERAMARLFPALARVGIERRWYGRVAVTPDHWPHVHMPENGLVAVVGCQGRGVALMTALGARVAAFAQSADPDLLPFPPTPIRPIPLHRLRRAGVAAAIAWSRVRDALER